MNARSPRLGPSRPLLTAFLLFVVPACGGGKAPARSPEAVSRSTVLVHEPCESGDRVEEIDVDGDGKPDIRRMFGRDGKERCRVTDLSRDGKPDLYEYFDPNGELRRREASYDAAGGINTIDYFEGGKLGRREIDTLGKQKIDTWDYFDPATGKRVRRERDSNGNGVVDQWWSFDGGRTVIEMDTDHDGKRDPAATVVLGESAPPPAPSAPQPAAPAGDQGAQGTTKEAAPSSPPPNAAASQKGATK